jgi:uncharacterized protein YukE
MTTIHMEVEACQNIQSRMDEISAALQDNLEALSRALNDLGTIWRGGSQVEYEREYSALKADLQKEIDDLKSQSTTLGRAVELGKASDAHL